MMYFYVILAFLLSFALAALVTPKVISTAIKYSIYDALDERKTHQGAVPRIGGIAFVPCVIFAMLLLLGVFFIFDYKGELLTLPCIAELCCLFAGVILVFLFGIHDDLLGLLCRYKFIAQTIAAFIIILSGLYISDYQGLVGLHEFDCRLAIALTALIIVFITNAFNLIDGMDGLASGLAIFALCIYGALFFNQQQWLYSALAFSTVGVLIPFVYFNVFGNVIQRRKLFMGDAGSLTLGLILAFLAVRYARPFPGVTPEATPTLVIAFSPILLPMLDVARVILARIKQHKNIFEADRNHIHHKLQDMGLSKTAALIALIALNALMWGANLMMMHHIQCSYIFLIDIVFWIVLNLYFTRIRKRKLANS